MAVDRDDRAARGPSSAELALPGDDDSIISEQPIYSTRAHAFLIDPSTKKNWLPASSQAVGVSFYFDSSRNSYRIISMDGKKAIINSTVTTTMNFTKTSQKFGQWSDPRANTVYGLGFSTEADLGKFVEKFSEVQELLLRSSSPMPERGARSPSAEGPPIAARQLVSVVNGDSAGKTYTGSPTPSDVSDDVSGPGLHHQPMLPDSERNGTSAASAEEQLKYENGQLRIALKQSCANGRQWAAELQTLKSNNDRLTTALQETTVNFEEWKKQLTACKEENLALKKRLQDVERTGGSGSEKVGGDQVNELSDHLRTLKITNKRKQEEIELLQRKCHSLQTSEGQLTQAQERLQNAEAEATSLRQQLSESTKQFESLKLSQNREKQHLRSLHSQLKSKLAELGRLEDQMNSALL